MEQIVLGLTGHIAAGKGLAAEYFHTTHHASLYRFSNMLRDVLNRLYLPHSRENLQRISTVIRQTFGEDAMSNVISKEIQADANPLIIVDGIRRVPDVISLKKLPHFYLITITASPETRYRRIIERTENTDDRQKTFDQFLVDEQQETEVLIDEISARADFTIVNDGTVEELQKQLETILTKINHRES